MPFPIPKYYFGDMNKTTTNFILITEKVLYAQETHVDGTTSPHDRLMLTVDTGVSSTVTLEPAFGKFHDEFLSNVEEYYFALIRAQARMAGWDHAGRLGDVGMLLGDFTTRAPPLDVNGIGFKFDLLKEFVVKIAVDFDWVDRGLNRLLVSAPAVS